MCPKQSSCPNCVDEKIAEISFFTSLAQSHISSTNVFIYIWSVFFSFSLFLTSSWTKRWFIQNRIYTAMVRVYCDCAVDSRALMCKKYVHRWNWTKRKKARCVHTHRKQNKNKISKINKINVRMWLHSSLCTLNNAQSSTHAYCVCWRLEKKFIVFAFFKS